jgi:hypothetical protein
MAYRSNYIHVPAGDVLAIRATDEQFLIGTSGLASCVGLSVCDINRQIGGVAHVFIKRADEASYGKPDQDVRSVAFSLVRKADELGGMRYSFKTFNIKRGYRAKFQTEILEALAKTIKAELHGLCKIADVEARDEPEFILDVRSGVVTIPALEALCSPGIDIRE